MQSNDIAHLRALNNQYGRPTLFLTVTPADGYLCEVFYCNTADPYNLDRGGSLPLKCRGVYPLSFDEMLYCVMNDIIGWNMTDNVANIDGGLFGNVLAFLAVKESQQRQSDHAHFLIWLE